jgi:hypothetical protein
MTVQQVIFVFCIVSTAFLCTEVGQQIGWRDMYSSKVLCVEHPLKPGRVLCKRLDE